MRVCFPFIGDSVGGAQISTALLARALDPQRFEAVFLVLTEGPLTEYLSTTGLSWRLGWPGVNSRTIKRIDLPTLIQTVPSLASHLLTEPFDIIHPQDGRANILWSAPARFAKRAFIWQQRARYSRSRITSVSMRLAHRVLCNSDYVRRTMPHHAARRASVILNPFNTDAVGADRTVMATRCRAALPTPETDAVVGFVGNLTPQKRPDLFVEAAIQLSKRTDRRLGFLVLGADRSAMRPDLEENLTAAGIESFRFLGFQPDAGDWLAGFNVLLAPQVGDGFGRVLVEAMLAGTPVVAARSGGHIEVIEDGVTGLLVNPDDVTALVDATLRLLEDDRLRERVVRQARQSARNRYAVNRHAEEMTAVYETLVD